MAIREIVWTVADNGKTIHPTAPQDGGVQGEHNATRAVWRVGENSVWETPTFKVYVECEDNAGNVDHTEPLQVVGGQISVLLPLAWTQYGGMTTLRLVAEEEDGVVAYLVEGYARFSSRQNASQKVDGLMKGRLAQMEARMKGAVADATSAAEDAAAAAEAAVVAKNDAVYASQSASVSRSGAQYFAEQAAGAAGDATSAAQEAAKLKDEIETKLKNGKFKGDKGDDGVSPTVSVTAITGGHRVSITDAYGTKTFDVLDGEDGNAASVTIDTTLTKAGQAADAKAVGDAFATATADFEKALQHLAPLVGTSESVTPSDVYTALTEGRQVVLTHTEEDLGKVTFNSFAVLDDSMVAAHATATMEGVAANMTLLGTVAEGVWNLALVQIPSTEVFQPYLLPDVTTKDNGKLLQVVDGAWTAVAMTDVSEVGM